jgi:hypothetical protein
MATEAQATANQANAQHSTGPVTPEGKAKSSRNRLSFGFASNTRFIKGEDPDEFSALLYSLMAEHLPATITEQILVEKMAHNQWISLRAIRIPGEVLSRMVVFSDIGNNLSLLIRYQTAADRAFHKAHAELVKARKQKGTTPIGFESKNAQTAQATQAAPPPPAAEAPKPPAAPPAPPAKPAPPVQNPPIAPVSPSPEAELHWIMNATAAEIRSSAV